VFAALRDHQAAAHREILVELPDYGAPDLHMSDLLLFDKVVDRKAYREARSPFRDATEFLGATNPVFLKNFVLIPSSDSRFRRSQKLTAFFEVYNPSLEPGSEAPALRLRCRFRREDGAVQDMPERMLDYLADSTKLRTSYGISVPLLGFSTGRYTVEFDIYDTVQDKHVQKAAAFTVY
jgi:hypothetical protein